MKALAHWLSSETNWLAVISGQCFREVWKTNFHNFRSDCHIRKQANEYTKSLANCLTRFKTHEFQYPKCKKGGQICVNFMVGFCCACVFEKESPERIARKILLIWRDTKQKLFLVCYCFLIETAYITTGFSMTIRSDCPLLTGSYLSHWIIRCSPTSCSIAVINELHSPESSQSHPQTQVSYTSKWHLTVLCLFLLILHLRTYWNSCEPKKKNSVTGA